MQHQICISQVYTPFTTRNAFWSERSSYFNGTQIIEEIYTIYLDSDTIVNSLVYTKLHSSGVRNEYTPQWVFTGSSNFDHQFGLIREDTAKHIYFYFLGTEYLLYDFNLQLNDTLNPTAYYYPLLPGTYVSMIDSVLVGSKYRKQFHLSVDSFPSNYIVLIEGIGSSFGLINFTGPPFENSAKLFCYRSDSGLCVLDSFNCIFSNIENPNNNQNIIVYPNPFLDFLNVETLEMDLEINIFDLLYREKLRSRIILGACINTESIEPGMYIYQIKNQNYILKNGIIIKN